MLILGGQVACGNAWASEPRKSPPTTRHNQAMLRLLENPATKNTHTHIIYIKRDIFGWCFFYIFVGPALAMGWWSNMSYVFGIGWNQHRRIIVGYPLQGVGAAEVTYTCKMDPLYGDIVSGRTGHRATRLQFPVQFRTPQHLRKLNPNTDSHIFWECQWVHISIGLCAIPTCVGESPLILVNLSVPAAILSIAQRVVSLTK